jgi:membrane-bound lytic murein transglycosylase B
LEGKATIKSVSEWNALGVRTEHGEPLPYQDLQASVIEPYGGPTFLAFPNYRMILRYNNSIYYAGAIGYLADKVCQAH